MDARMDLRGFLLARISEDEVVARKALAAEGYQVWQVQDWVEVDPGCLDHVDRHHPLRVLADCAARRGIVRLQASAEAEAAAGVGLVPGRSSGQADGLRAALVQLAQPYSGHADFDPLWVPRRDRAEDRARGPERVRA